MEKNQLNNKLASNEAGLSRKELSSMGNVVAIAALSAVTLLPSTARAEEMPSSSGVETEIGEPLHIELADIQAVQPLTRSLHDGHGVVDLAEAILGPETSKDRPQVRGLALRILTDNGLQADLDSKEAKNLPKGTIIYLNMVETAGREQYIIQKGDTAWNTYQELGWQDAGYSFNEFARANAIIDKTKIYSGESLLLPPGGALLEASTAKPSTPIPSSESKSDKPPVLPPTPTPKFTTAEQPTRSKPAIEGPPIKPILKVGQEISTKAADAGQLNITPVEISLNNTRRYSQEEAQAGMDLLINATRAIENPLHNVPVNLNNEKISTPITDSLSAQTEYWISELTSGESNLAYIQNQTIRQLSSQVGAAGSDAKLEIATDYVQFIARQNSWKLTPNQADDLARMLIEGTSAFEFTGANWSQIDRMSYVTRDDVSLTLELLDSTMTSQLAEQIELVHMADEQIEQLAPSLSAIDEGQAKAIARTMISSRSGGKLANDYLYEVLVAKLGDKTEKEGLSLLVKGVLTSRLSADLPKLFPDFDQEINRLINDFSASADSKELLAFTQQIDEKLDLKIDEIYDYSLSLTESQIEVDSFDSSLPQLEPAVLYEVAKVILSDRSTGNIVQDDWYYLIDAKAFALNINTEEAVAKMVEGIYSAEDAAQLWQMSEEERDAAIASIEDFMASGDLNLNQYLNQVFSNLENRITGAQADSEKIIEAVKIALPDADINDLDIMTLAIDKLAGNNNRQLADYLISDYQIDKQRPLTEVEQGTIDIELLKLSTSDEQSAGISIGEYLYDYFAARNAVQYVEYQDASGAINKSADPAIRKLAQMINSGQYNISYPEGEVAILSAEFVNRLKTYDTVAAFIFPGESWQVLGYAGQDLTPFFERLGLDTDKILASPFNEHLKMVDGQILADDARSIWFDAGLWQGKDQPDFEAAVEWAYGPIPGFAYTTKKGDTYQKIAQMFRVDGKVPDWREILEWNRGRLPTDPTKLMTNQDVVLPPEWDIYLNFDKATSIKTETSKEKDSKSHDRLPTNAKLEKTDLGSLGTIEIVQLNDTFKTSKSMTPSAVINHWTGGNYSDETALEDFIQGLEGNLSCSGGCSVHFFISEQGTIYQLSDLDSRLAHAKGANSFGVGIEIEGSWGNDGMPNQSQYEAAKKLNAYLVQELNLQLANTVESKNGIFGHYEIDGSYLDPDDSGKTDPGKKFLNQLRHDIDVWANPASAEIAGTNTGSLSLDAEHQRIKDKVAKEVSSLTTYANPYGLSADNINSPETVFTVDEMAQNRLDKNATGNSWETYIGPPEGAKELMEALIVYGGILEIDAPGFTPEELLLAATATFLGEGGGYTHIVGDLKLNPGAKLDPTDNIPWSEDIASISTSSEQFYWTEDYSGKFRDPELVGNDHRIAASRAGDMIRQEMAAGRPVLDKWHYYRDWENEHAKDYQAHQKAAKKALADIKAGK